MYAILDWENGLSSTIKLETIVEPRKDINKYMEGEEVKAKWKDTTYRATIAKIGGRSFDSYQLYKSVCSSIKSTI